MDQFTNFTCINTSLTHIKIIIIEQTIIKLKPSFILIKKIFQNSTKKTIKTLVQVISMKIVCIFKDRAHTTIGNILF
jgi:hypothetical protein